MGEFRPLGLLLHTRPPGKEIPWTETVWKASQICASGKENSAIQSIAFNPLTSSSTCLLATGTKVLIQDLDDEFKTQTYSYIKSLVRCASFRKDGKLIVLGDDSGKMQVINVQNVSQLRRMKGHHGAVLTCHFSADKCHIMSGSSDQHLKYWDLVEGACIQTFSAHTDSIKSVATPLEEQTPYLWASGGYDGMIKLWDTRQETTHSIATFQHLQPIENVTFFQSGSMILSCGANEIKLWDRVADKFLHTIKNHTRTIVSAVPTSDGHSIVSASLDRTIKWHDMQTHQVQYSMELNQDITAFALSPNDRSICVGMSDGSWSARRRKNSQSEQETETQVTKRILPGSVQYLNRGKRSKPTETQEIHNEFQPVKNSRLDKLLRSFQYKAALDLALSQSSSHVASLFEELIQRGALHIALRGRDELSAIPILQFFYRNVGRSPTYTQMVLEGLQVLLSENHWVHSTSDANLLAILRKISQKLAFEIHQQKQLGCIHGMLDMILS